MGRLVTKVLEKCGIFLFHSFSLQPELLNINGVLFFWSKAGFGIDETSIAYFTISNCILIRILLIGHALYNLLTHYFIASLYAVALEITHYRCLVYNQILGNS
jgi:hypothetical protein